MNRDDRRRKAEEHIRKMDAKYAHEIGACISGSKFYGGFVAGSMAQEEELCRRGDDFRSAQRQRQ